MEYHLSFGLHKAKLPIIPIEIKEQYLCFILDTGSTCNLIDSTVVRIFQGYSRTELVTIVSVE